MEQKSASKVQKTCYFAYFSGQCWGDSSPPRLRYFIQLPFKKASISKCSSLRSELLGFQMSLPMLKSMFWALPQAGLQVRKLRTQGLGLRICEPIFYRKHLQFCSKKIETTANPQINNITGIVSAI